MAEVTFIAPVAKIKGKLHQKDRTVFRKKMVRDDEGRIIAEMKQEAYVVKHPRDWKKNPAMGAEKAKLDRWKEVCAQTKQILNDPDQRALWQERWQAQLKKAETDAPIDPRTRKRKIYIKFDCYVRSTVWRGLV
jgi:hypothetical protein